MRRAKESTEREERAGSDSKSEHEQDLVGRTAEFSSNINWCVHSAADSSARLSVTWRIQMNIQKTLNGLIVACLISACGGASPRATNATSTSQSQSATTAPASPASAESSTTSAQASCAPQDVNPEGICEAYFGVAWTGSDCVGVSGCGCAGHDCNNLYPSHEACRAAHAHCAH